MISWRYGDMLKDDALALVNPVNCVGVSGKGIAKQFARAYPDMQRSYEQAAREGRIQIGRMWSSVTVGGKVIICFPTKRHWKGQSRLTYITAGLVDLLEVLIMNQIPSVAVPALGCGNGGLPWDKVRGYLEKAAATTPNISWRIYPPREET